MAASASLSESESDSYGGRRARPLSKKHRRRLQHTTSGTSSPVHGEVRFSSRTGGKVKTYKEDDEEHESEVEDIDTLTPNYWTTEDSSPAIDMIINHRRKEGSFGRYPEAEDFEYHVKWQEKSYYHSTWEPWSSLSSRRGFRKLKNYFTNVVSREIRMDTDPTCSLDEKEKYLLDRESQADTFEENTQVERVIDTQEGEEGTEYLVKWKGLNYDHCTWEEAELVSKLAQSEIDRYLDRTSRLPILNKSESNPRTRSPYKVFRDQPDYIKNGELREFQIKGVNFLAHNWCKGNSVILADEMGLGKTVLLPPYHYTNRYQPANILIRSKLCLSSAGSTTSDNNKVHSSWWYLCRQCLRGVTLSITGLPILTSSSIRAMMLLVPL